MGIENVIKYGSLIASLPLPATGAITSAQCAAYCDGTYIHVWYGCHVSGEDQDEEDIYYTKTADLTSWDAATKVIEGSGLGEGLRDPTLVVEASDLYLFVQCCTSTSPLLYDTIRLWKIGKADDFTDSLDYTAVGVVLEAGSSGEFDDTWLASPAVREIGGVYYLVYEAKNSLGEYSVGLAYSNAIETIPYTKVDQLKDLDGDVVRNPYGAGFYIVPDNFFDDETLVLHAEYSPAYPPETIIVYMKLELSSSAATVKQYDEEDAELSVDDVYDSHNNVSFPLDSSGDLYGVGSTIYFLEQTWDYGSAPYLRIYGVSDLQDNVLLDGNAVKCKDWDENAVSLESTSDEWINRRSKRKTAQHGSSLEFALSIYEESVNWMDSIVHLLEWKMRKGKTLMLSSDKTLRQIIREVVVVDVSFVGVAGEADAWREYVVTLREA